MKKFGLIGLFLLIFSGCAHAQGPQCRTSTVGASTANCASEAFVTKSNATAAQISGTPTAGQFAEWTNATTIDGVSPASKSDQQTGTSTTAAVTPSQQQSHDSAAKAWISFVGSSAAVNASYNATVSRTVAGDYTVTFTTPFASANYACIGSTTTNFSYVSFFSQVAGSIGVLTAISGSAGDPASVMISCFGRQ